MIRVCVLAMIICSARAGVIDLGGYDGHGVIGAPALTIAQAPIAVAHAPLAIAHAPLAVAHGAESWQNNNLLALNPTAVVTKVAAPVVTKVAVASPVYTKLAAPISLGVAAAPWGGIGLGGYH